MKRILYSLTALLLVTSSCKKGFLDINENPNAPTEASITPDLILPRALHATGSRMATSYDFAAHWMGYWARSGTYGPSTEEESYNITTGFQADEWSGWYDILTDYNTMEQKANASGQGFYEGIAKTMKTFGFMYLVDQYDNVPYSQAFNLATNIQPAYDKGQDIYNDLLNQLDQAIVLIDKAELGANPNLATSDIMFNGDKTMWKKLINTQRLKLLIRQSQVPGFNPAPQIAKITAEGFLQSGETASVNPGYVQDNTKQNPFWNSYEQNYLGETVDDYNRANNYVLGILRNTNDIRYQYYFDPVSASCPTCTPPITAGTYFGYDYGFVNPDPNQPKAGNSSGVGGKGLARSPNQDQWVFTSVESMFLQAEAKQRGWLTGDAKAAYEAAVRESFIWLGVTNAVATANTYLASGNAIVSWDLAANKINLIVMQKYLALVGINNFEAWVDYRRVGVPAVPKSLAPSVGANIPVRLRYPQSEYNYNAAVVGAESNPNPFTAPVFWDR